VRFRCERDVLANALGTAARAAKGGSLPVLAGVHVSLTGNHLRVTGSDLDLTIRVDETVNGEGDGAVVVPARLASDIVRNLESGAVEISVDGEVMTLASGRAQFDVRTLPVEDYPRLPEPGAETVELRAADLAEALRQVVKAASTDEARPILTGVLVAAEETGLRLVATDSYRLALRDLPGTQVLTPGQRLLIPSRALAELARILDPNQPVVVRLGDRDVTFETGGARLSSRLIEGEFPNYRQLIPSSSPNRLSVSRDALLDALRRVRLLAREATPVRLRMSADGLELSAITQDVGQASEQLDAKYEGSELTVAFNPQYLSDGVEAVAPDDEVHLETVDALKPAVIRSGTSDQFLYLLMPVRVP
jgi:DNA polymerase-3 subunit beta